MKKLILLIFTLYLTTAISAEDKDVDTYYTTLVGKVISIKSGIGKINVLDENKKVYTLQKFKLSKEAKYFDENGSYELFELPKGKKLYIHVEFPNVNSYKNNSDTGLITAISSFKELY